MPKNVTIKLSDETAHWARKKAAEQNTSVSQLVGRMLEEEMRRTDAYWKAFEQWKVDRPVAASSAADRLTRDQVHERR